MNHQQMRERANRVRSIPLCSVLLAVGAEQDREDKARWHTCRGVISITGCKFMNWNLSTGGGGAIDLVIHLNGLDFNGAVAWLCCRFPGRTPEQPACKTPRPHLRLPAPDPGRLSDVKHYLVSERRIRPAPIEHLIRSGDLYADHYANAVFVLRSANNTLVGAELRGSGPRSWRGMAPGSRKNMGFFSIRNVDAHGIILCESAIDALSCLAIHPDHWCISTAGARPNPAWLPQIIRHGLPIYCGFDADSAGDDMAETMIKRYPSIKRLRPPMYDWNDMLPTHS